MSAVSERRIVFVVGAIQFVNIVDFMMVMPMGPDFARALGIPTSQLGYIGGAYTAAASLAGLVGALFLDRFDRKKALGVAMLGLAVGTALGGVARGFGTLLAARMVAGAFGGPATALAMSIIADVIPPARRGKAMGAVMGAFSAASVLGVPAGLELARRGGFRMPFFSVALLGLVIWIFAMRMLPSLTGHLAHREASQEKGFGELLARPTILASYTMTAVALMAGFILIPNISGYLQINLAYPRERIGLLYLSGGVVSFFAMRLAGWLVDRFGSFRVATAAALIVTLVTWSGFGMSRPPVPIVVIFMGFMLSNSLRNVAYNTLTSKVPRPPERARFMSLQSAVAHAASAIGAFLSARLLREGEGGRLIGMADVATVSIALALCVPVLMRIVERRVHAEARAHGSTGA
jgi:predicted MFS family arabinose efflux permease